MLAPPRLPLQAKRKQRRQKGIGLITRLKHRAYAPIRQGAAVIAPAKLLAKISPACRVLC
ncbi:hypothetical protein C5688_05555 [Methylocystis sp. MitZ-2018]|nr:hypothetical protein C5688_05555 [Methylocystis sp. MitZ-2018]